VNTNGITGTITAEKILLLLRERQVGDTKRI